MKIAVITSFLAMSGLYLASPALATELTKPWLVRARVVEIDTANKSEPIGALGVAQRDTLHVSNETIPELDITYFFSSNWAAELVLTYPQKHEVTLEMNGLSTSLGSFKHLPPVLSVQYHFHPTPKLKPYVGVGLNYTDISSVKLAAGTQALDLEGHSMGLAVGAGIDYAIQDNLYLNFDLKKVQIRSDVLASGQKISRVEVDPLLIGLGLGWRF